MSDLPPFKREKNIPVELDGIEISYDARRIGFPAPLQALPLDDTPASKDSINNLQKLEIIRVIGEVLNTFDLQEDGWEGARTISYNSRSLPDLPCSPGNKNTFLCVMRRKHGAPWVEAMQKVKLELEARNLMVGNYFVELIDPRLELELPSPLLSTDRNFVEEFPTLVAILESDIWNMIPGLS
jgi:hypothetical protein